MNKELWNLKKIKKLLDNMNIKIKKINLNTSMDLFSSEDNKLKSLSHFDWLNSYFTIVFDNWDQLSLWDFNEYQVDSDNVSTRNIEQINDLLKDNDNNFIYTLNELNNFIEQLSYENNIIFNN